MVFKSLVKSWLIHNDNTMGLLHKPIIDHKNDINLSTICDYIKVNENAKYAPWSFKK